MLPSGKVFGFTIKAKSVLRVLKSNVTVSQAFDPSQKPDPLPPHKEFQAIWDTGATNTVITQKIVDECGLKPIGMTQVHHVGGTTTCEVYLINIVLPNKVRASFLRVSRGIINDDVDILIGMDLITQGDFAISNFEGKTALSFRIPSCGCIDFGEEKMPTTKLAPPALNTPYRAPQKVGPNQPCPCGSGKKYKKCHGRNF